MAYEVIMLYHLHMPLYFVGTFTEYPKILLVGFFRLFSDIPSYARTASSVLPAISSKIFKARSKTVVSSILTNPPSGPGSK